MDNGAVGKSTFLLSWVALIALTFALIGVSTSGMAPVSKHLLIFAMMLIQAYLVSFYFMHLRFEKFPLVISVVAGILVTAMVLYLAIVWDSSRMMKLFNL